MKRKCLILIVIFVGLLFCGHVYAEEKSPFEFTDEECQFFFAHCTYYIQIRGLDGKPERMRDLRGFHKVLFTAFLLLTLASAIDCIYSGMSQSHYICFFASLLLSLIFLALYKRNEEYRFRMIMALYFEAESKELTE